MRWRMIGCPVAAASLTSWRRYGAHAWYMRTHRAKAASVAGSTSIWGVTGGLIPAWVRMTGVKALNSDQRSSSSGVRTTTGTVVVVFGTGALIESKPPVSLWTRLKPEMPPETAAVIAL